MMTTRTLIGKMDEKNKKKKKRIENEWTTIKLH